MVVVSSIQAAMWESGRRRVTSIRCSARWAGVPAYMQAFTHVHHKGCLFN